MITMKLIPSLLTLVIASVSLDTAAARAAVAPGAQGYTALPLKKSGSGVEMSYRIEGTPVPGSPLIVRLTTSSRTDAQITLRGGEGLVVTNAGSVLVSAAGQVMQHLVQVTPQTQGRFYLYVESSANGRGSSNAIAVQVGKSDVQRKPSGNVQSMPNGERVISVPAKQ
jgi:hypothetical protein